MGYRALALFAVRKKMTVYVCASDIHYVIYDNEMCDRAVRVGVLAHCTEKLSTGSGSRHSANAARAVEV